tara:strand:- start:81 stop:611 length:531 start_codon:yes stop_codon:yes gene_type:complete
MKKLLLILLCLPMIGFGQGQVNCSLLEVTDVVIDNTNMTIDIAVYNGDTMNSHYPFIDYTIDFLGDTIQTGDISWYVTPALDMSWYSYTISSPIIPVYPLSLYFAYTNLTGFNPGDYTCILTYNISPTNITDINIEGNRKCIRVIDVLGRDIKSQTNTPLIEIYDDGTVKKKIILE